jgi:NHL repeat
MSIFDNSNLFGNIAKLQLQNTMKIVLAFFTLIFITLTVSGQIITTFAGNGTAGSSGNGGTATSAQLNKPNAVCSDNAGNIYIADHHNHVIRKVNSAGIISIFAGTGIEGNSGDGGPAIAANIGWPIGICRDNNGNIYIADRFFCVIRKVDNAGNISTYAGTGVFGYSGDGGPAINAKMFAPSGICIDNGGNLYIAEFGNQIIRKVNSSGIISTVAGIPQMSGYWGDGGPAVDALLASPTDVSCDNLGNYYIADRGNNIVRKVNTSGIITRFAGNGFGYAGNGGPALAASFHWIYNVLADNLGNL